jgi:hypothetical protein
VSGSNQAGKAGLRFDVNCGHQIQPQQREVSQVVLRKLFAAQVSMNTAQAAEAARSNADSFEVGQFNAPVVAYHYVFNATLAIYENANLSPGLKR